MTMKSSLSLSLSVLLIMLLSVSALFAQETTGSIEITVKDSASAVVPNVTLEVVNSAKVTFLTSTSTSSEDGLVRNVSIVRLRSFWAIVASARDGVRKKSESG